MEKARTRKPTAKKIISLVIAAALIIGMIVPACADTSGSITVSYQTDAGSMSGETFYIYKVADTSLNFTNEFSGCGVDLSGAESTSDWTTAAYTLSAYAGAKCSPVASGVTGSDGLVTFESLSEGMYLVVGYSKTYGNTVYTPTPFLVTVPYNTEGGTDYNPTVSVKYEKYTLPDTPEGTCISISIQKLWDDDDIDRPESVTVELLRDGAVYDTVILAAANNWRYTWYGLDCCYTVDGSVHIYNWQTIEIVPEGYYMESYATSDGTGIAFTIVNRKPIPDNPVYPDEQNEPADTDGEPDDSVIIDETPEETLPQTGQINAPIPILAGCGLAFVLTGVFILTREPKKRKHK